MTDDRKPPHSRRMRVITGHQQPGLAAYVLSRLESAMSDDESSFPEYLLTMTTVAATCFTLSSVVGFGFGLGWHVARRIKG